MGSVPLSGFSLLLHPLKVWCGWSPDRDEYLSVTAMAGVEGDILGFLCTVSESGQEGHYTVPGMFYSLNKVNLLEHLRSDTMGNILQN